MHKDVITRRFPLEKSIQKSTGELMSAGIKKAVEHPKESTNAVWSIADMAEEMTARRVRYVLIGGR
jgi:hypothetical protein